MASAIPSNISERAASATLHLGKLWAARTDSYQLVKKREQGWERRRKLG